MRTIILVALTIFFTGVTKAQHVKTADLVGTWSIAKISLEKGNLSYDAEKDQVHVSDSIRKSWSNSEDSALAMMGVVMLKEATKGLMLVFKEGNRMEEKMSNRSREGTFSFDEATGTLVMKTKGEKKAIVKKEGDILVLDAQETAGPEMKIFLRKK